MKNDQVGIRLGKDSWHLKQLLSLAYRAGVSPTVVARDLLCAALEQTSDAAPPKPQPLHLELFYNCLLYTSPSPRD